MEHGPLRRAPGNKTRTVAVSRLNKCFRNGLNAPLWKDIDNTATSEVAAKGKESEAQLIADRVTQSIVNIVKLKSDRCKELRFLFSKNQPEFQHIVVNGKELECVRSAKLLGVTISNNLSMVR